MGKKLFRCIISAGLGIAVFQSVRAQGQLSSSKLVDYVEPLSGTAPSTSPAALAHSEAGSERSGNTIPAVGLPFGMTQFTPQTTNTEQ